MKIFQLIDWLTKLFKLNNRSKIILLILLPLPIFSQNNAAFWLGKRPSGAAPTNLLLDDYPGAAAAYSVRKLDKDYTGFAMEIRRASDNATQNIGFVGEDLDEVAINSFCSGTTCYVRTWYDQSGNNFNLIQSTLTRQPLIYNSGIITQGSKPAMSLNFNQHFPLLNFDNQTRIDAFITSKPTSTSYIYFSSLNGFAYLLVADQNITSTGITQSSGSPNIYINSILFTGTTRGDLYNALNKHNNISILNINTTASDWSNGYFLAYYLPAGSFYPSFQFTGTLQEMFFYHNDQSSNRSNLENNINSYYSIY